MDENEILTDIRNMMNAGVDVSIPRKQIITVFGAVIAANITTIVVAGVLKGVMQSYLNKTVADV